MEMPSTIYRRPKYTFQWLGIHILFFIIAAVFATAISNGINCLAENRVEMGLLKAHSCNLISQASIYCFGIVALTLISISFIELTYRKNIFPLQYGLIACALCLFNLLLLALSEQMSFWTAYTIVSAMTIALISIFVKEMLGNKKAAFLTSSILIVEYIVTAILISLGSLALLVASLLLFVVIAVAMYFTIKLKTENEELFLK